MYTSVSDGRHDATVYNAAVDAVGVLSMLLACRRRAPSMDPYSKNAASNARCCCCFSRCMWEYRPERYAWWDESK